MSDFWERRTLAKLKNEEEEKEKEEDRDTASLSFWERRRYKELTGNDWEDPSKMAEPEPEEQTIVDRLAARGITVEMPTEKKTKTPEDTAYTEPDQYSFQSLRPSLTGEGSTLADTAGKDLFSSRLRSTATANEERTKQLAAQLEEVRKDETVRNEEWISSLRPKEEIEKDLEEAKKETGAAKREDYWNGLLGDLRGLVDNEYRLSRSRGEDLNPKTQENKARIQALEDELAERTWADYERLRNNADFDAKSQYKSTATGKEVKVGLTGIDARGAYEDPLYDYINGDTDAKWALERNKNAGVRQNAQYATAVAQNAEEYTQYSYLTKDEKSLYNYIHATEGPEKANEYLAYLMSDLYERQATKEKEMAAQWADQNELTRAASTVGSVLASPMKGSAYIGQAAEMLTTGKVDENAPYNRAAYIPNELRTTVSKNIERNWGKWGSFAYNTGMSMLDFLWTSAVSGGSEALSLALMGTGAAADATMAAKERGLDDKTAFVLGTIAGAAEIASEKVSIEALFKSANWKSAPVKYILQNFFFEGAEEVESDAINWLADAIVARDKSEWMDDIRAYQEDNPDASENKAFWNAVWKRVKEGGLDFLGGAISGGVMAGSRVAGANILDTAKRSSDRSADIEATRRATAAVRGLNQNQNAANVSAGMQQAQQQTVVLPTAEQAEAGQGPTVIPQVQPTQEETEFDRILNEGFAEAGKFGEGELIRVRTPEEVRAAQNASEAAQSAEAMPEGIPLRTAEEAETAQAAKTTRSAETETKAEAQEPRFGTEPEVRTLTPTVEEAEINDAVQNAEDAGNITRATGIRYGVDEKTIRKAENYGRLTGNTVEFYKGQAKNGTVENGFVDKRNRRIYYNVDAKQPFQFTVGHEFTHTLEGTREYADLADHVKTRAAEQGKDWEAMREDIREVYERSGHGTLTDVEIDEELVADWIGENLSDEKTIREICRETPSAAKKLRDALDQLVIKAANMTDTLSPYEAEKMQNVIGLYDKYLGRAEEARRNAQPQAVPAQQQAQNAQPAAESVQTAAESVQTEKNTKEWKSWENAGRELTDKWSGINSGEFVAALEELYAAASENAPRTQDGKIDPAQVDYNAVEQAAIKLANDLTDSAEVTEDNPEFAEQREARKYLQKTPIWYDADKIRAEFGDKESYNRWRKSLFGTLRLTTDRSAGIPADVVFSEFAEQYPGHVDLTVDNDADRLKELAKAAEELRQSGGKKTAYNPYEQGKDEAVNELAVDLLSELTYRLQGEEPVRKWEKETSPSQKKKKPAQQKTVQQTAAEQISFEENQMDAQGKISPDQLRAQAEELYDEGEIDEKQYEYMNALADEAESTGRGIESSTVQEEAPNGKLGRAIDKMLGRQYSISPEAEEQSRENAKTALAYFGKTYSWNETGYITRSGDRIDFSGKHDGGPGGYRTVDHRDISDALGLDYGGDDYSGAMIRFMGEGNIRITPEVGGINIGPVEPTAQQYERLKDFIQKNRGEVILDIDDSQGETVASRDYPNGTRSSKVLNDIREYFATGVLPEEDVRYSLSPEDQREQVESPAFMRWFGDWRNDPENASKVVNEDGTPKIVYHGTARGDRVGNVFLPERATSGPMAYFTDSEQIAANYARDKADTSIAYDEDHDGSYESQFRVQDEGKSIRLVDAWNRLKMRDRLAIREAVKHVTWDEDMENIVYDEDAQAGTGGMQDWRFRERNGNAIAALVDEWLNDGNLYGNEGDFMEAVRLAGIPEALERVGLGEAYYDDPNFRDEKVYGVYLNIRNPLVTTELDESFADALEEWWDEQDDDAYRREYNRADEWDKNRWDLYDWIDRLRSDIENGTTHVWTSIPDAVTDFLKSEGYDGIEDQGGKFHDEGHTVYIPFESTQIKSATDNVGTFDPENPDIRYSVSAEEDEADTDERKHRYDYNTLVQKDNVKIVPMKTQVIPTSGKKLNLGKMAEAGKENASVLSKDGYIQRYVFIPDVGENVLINSDGVKHGITGNKTNSSTMDTAQVTYYLPEILRNSVAVNEINPRSAKDGEYSYTLFGYAEDENGQGYLVKSTLNHYGENKSVIDDIEIYNVLKGIRGKKTNAEVIGDLSKTRGGLTRNASASEISIAQLLDTVKRIHPEFLSEDVRQHLGVQNAKREEGLRYSVSQKDDADYMQAVENGDTETQQRMVEEAARNAGYDSPKLYHGTDYYKEITVFRGGKSGYLGPGIYLTPDESLAKRYADRSGDGGRIYSAWAKITNPLYVSSAEPAQEILREITGSDRVFNNRMAKQAWTTQILTKADMNKLRAKGYDGIIWKYGTSPEEYLVFESNQLKSADPVTYDDEGNVIPLSQRFNPEEDDIRYSVSDTGEGEQEDLTGMTQKAKSAALRIERQLTSDILQGIDRQLSPTGQEFRQFRRDVARPAVEAMLRGEPYDTDAVLEATGIDIVGQAAARGAVNDALRRANGELGRIRTAAQETEARKAAREARNAELDARIPQDTGGLIELANSVKDAQKRLNTLKARTIMSEEDMETAHKIATGQMTEEEAYAQYPFGVDDIINMAQAEREFREAEAPWTRYTKRLAQQRYETADRDLENADRANDKGNGFAYARETPERNFRDVFGGDAAALIDDYIRPVHKSEAASTRFKNDYIQRAEDLKLSRKVRRGNANSEAAAVQFLGEALDNVRVLEAARSRDAVRDGKTLEEWRADIQAFYNANPNLDYDKVNQGIAEFQSIYNELINRMNEVLVENGYMPVNVRRGYFPHFNGGSDGILATFANLLGIHIDTNALPTSINGLTSMFKPGKPWFGHAMERTGFATDYDALQGFEGYLGGVSDVIHQTPNIRNLRALGTRIRYRFGDEQIRKRIDAIEADDTRSETEKLAAIHDLTENGKYKLSRFVSWLDEYTNQLANKKSKYDRGIEDLMGRRVYTWMKNIEGRVAANMIAGNLGSALTNFIPMNQAAAMLGDGNVLKGAFQTMTNRANTDDFINRSDFLTNRRGVDPLIRGASDTVSDWLSKPMNIIDDFTSETIVRAAYNKYLKQGMDEQSAMQAADEFAAGVMADRSKGALPTIFGSHNPLTKLFTQFQVEVNNEFSTIFKDIPKGTYRDDKDKKKAVAVAAWTLLRYFIGAYLFNDVYEHFVGRRAALDPIDLLNDAVGDFTGKKLNNTWDALVGGEGFLEEQKRANPSDAVTNLGKSTLEELPFVGGLFGGGRIPISSALPDAETIVKGLTNENWSGSKKAQVVGRELGKTIGTYILPPFAGGAGKKAYQTVENTLAGGRYVKDAEGNDQLQYPYFTDTPLETAGTVLQSLAFGPTATEGGRDWVEQGFGNQSAKNTALYKELTEDLGESQRESWDFLRSLRQQDTYGKRIAVAESNLSEEGKAAAMEAVLDSGNSTEGTKFRAAYNNGVSAEAWAALYGAMDEYDLNGNKQYTQAEIRDALDSITVPVSESEGAVQGLFGGSTETRHLTNAEKAALWSAYNPKWKASNNPYDSRIGERVVSEYNRLKGGEE